MIDNSEKYWKMFSSVSRWLIGSSFEGLMQKELFVYIVDKRVIERKRETEKRKETLPCVEETTCWIVEWIGNDTKVNNAGMHPLSKHYLATTACVCELDWACSSKTTKPSMWKKEAPQGLCCWTGDSCGLKACVATVHSVCFCLPHPTVLSHARGHSHCITISIIILNKIQHCCLPA